MESKKIKITSLESKKVSTCLIGFIISLAILFAGCASDAKKANTVATLEEDVVLDVAEQMPEFPGGEMEMFAFFRANLQYPEVAMEHGIKGRVIVDFVINRDGSITNATVSRSLDPTLDEEALRVVNAMPKWTPGQNGGKPVRVKYVIPVSFSLE